MKHLRSFEVLAVIIFYDNGSPTGLQIIFTPNYALEMVKIGIAAKSLIL
jgi:hypothetical protein